MGKYALIILCPAIGVLAGMAFHHFSSYRFSPEAVYERRIEGDKREFLVVERRTGDRFLFVKNQKGEY